MALIAAGGLLARNIPDPCPLRRVPVAAWEGGGRSMVVSHGLW